ncbi:hypothetical protein M0657_010682 [Pyricularia oryzae]|nr:hypothetical protein M0657_010682 [Pyricularia oryzae]KAI7913469.1 hypothetical protein M9X92_009421 [Pyricularia oryzae]
MQGLFDNEILISPSFSTQASKRRMRPSKFPRCTRAGLRLCYHGLTQESGSATYSTGRRNGGPSMSGQPAFPAPTRTGLCSAGRTGHRQNVDSLAGFIMESILSTGGIVPPKGYLKRTTSDAVAKAPGPELGQAVWGRALKLGLSCNVVNWPGMGGVFRLAPLIAVTEDD